MRASKREVEAQLTCKQRVREHLSGRLADFRKFRKAGWDDAGPEMGQFNEYGLCFCYYPAGTWTDQKEGFFQYQLSTGGPGDEFRFFVDADLHCHRIEYWFLDWNDGAKVILGDKRDGLLREVWDIFNECGSVEAEIQKAKER
jgi:hypothetical protein